MVKSNIPEGITREHVLLAIDDYLKGVKHGFSPSTKYDLVHEGHRLPPKAIVGLAARRATGTLLTPKDFGGGEASVSFRLLRKLGFWVMPKPRKDWTKEECYFAVLGYDQLDQDREITKELVYRELSELLGRTRKSVEFKIQNVSACDPRPRAEKPISEAAHKQALLEDVFREFWSNRPQARAREAEMRERLKFPASSSSDKTDKDASDATDTFIEEGAATITHSKTRTRSRKLIEEGRKHFKDRDDEGKLRCAACGFVAPQGLLGNREVVQLHHTKPLADSGEGGHQVALAEALEHMLPLCPTCHVLAHTSSPPLELDEINALRSS